jgi:DNA polymerase-3 subunit gamma/tau
LTYLAIARKYRPATFDEIVGQDHVTRTLRNAIDRGRIHHAYLFCGARGVGKTTAARALAKSLNCVNGPTATPCGVCTSCVEVSNGTSQDLIEIDGASNNSVDDIRELRDSVRYAPTLGRRKIYLVDEVHMLSNAAFNALLKTLEEPPPHVVFIFATTEPQKIPDTILSRVQRFDFKRIPMTGVVQRLAEIAEAEGAVVSEAGLKLIARAGEGSMRDAQSLLDKVISFGGPEVSDEMVAETLGLIDRGLLYGMLEGLVKGKPDRCLDTIASVYDYGFELSQFTSEMLEVLRNATFVQLSEKARAHVDLPTEEVERLVALTDGVAPDRLSRLFSAMLDLHDQVSRSARPRIVLEMGIARLADVRPLQPVGQLVARLEQLERRLRQSGGGGGGGARAGALQFTRRGPSGPGRSRAAGSRVSNRRPPGGARTRSRRTPAAQKAPAADASDDDRWAHFVQELPTLDPPASFLGKGIPRRQGKQLIVTIAGGRAMASARREGTRDDVMDAFRRAFPRLKELVVSESLASTKKSIDPALEQEVLTDPTCQHILRAFGATLEDVLALETEKQT